jgi:hypothetical protein
VGQDAGAPSQNKPGGIGVSSSITGTATTRGVGGVARQDPGPATNGPANSGNGGAGAEGYYPSGNGGSGVVIIRYPSTFTIGGGSGLTFTTTTVGSDKVTTFTAGTGSISFS